MNNVFSMKDHDVFADSLKGKKILFATFPADGHFNPLTGLAVYLKNTGCDVRWYTSRIYTEKLQKLDIHHYWFKKALEAHSDNFDILFPERNKIKGQVRKLKFDMVNAFILRSPEYYADLAEIHKSFPFELVIADCAFTAIPFVKEKMNIPVISIGVFPLTETSRDLPPVGLGMTPSYTFFGRIKQALLRAITRRLIFGEPNRVMWALLNKYDIPHEHESVFDMLIKKSNLLLQSGTPGFEYKRSDLGENIRFIGALLPFSPGRKKIPWFDVRLTQYRKIVLVTQGTVEKDPEKIIVPALEAYKNTDTLIVATTGGSKTHELRKRYPYQNIIIEDFIPFGDIMPYADIYITNGGYGGVMLSIENELPMIVAGVHEGKNEINARIGYFKLGIDLKTERPKSRQIKESVEKLLKDKIYKENVIKLAKDLRNYDPNELCADYAAMILQKTGGLYPKPKRKKEKVY
ncbi:MAG: glycosyltransferase [Bacteroidota bacterium]|nr:glycosyltransferase [Bacteroidota bacterium]